MPYLPKMHLKSYVQKAWELWELFCKGNLSKTLPPPIPKQRSKLKELEEKFVLSYSTSDFLLEAQTHTKTSIENTLYEVAIIVPESHKRFVCVFLMVRVENTWRVQQFDFRYNSPWFDDVTICWNT